MTDSSFVLPPKDYEFGVVTFTQHDPKVLKWDLRFLEMAKLVSTWSKDPSTQTGAVIVDHHSVVSVGFNGFPELMPDPPELWNNREEKYSRVVHCEINAMIFANKPLLGLTLYTYPFMSCDRCVVQMLQAGIERFVAPVASPDKLERWGDAFKRTRKYIEESRATLVEIEL